MARVVPTLARGHVADDHVVQVPPGVGLVAVVHAGDRHRGRAAEVLVVGHDEDFR